MLSHLHIRNLAIIEDLEVGFGPGLNIVTGETGAGKSILIAALQLILGGRGRPELVRSGAARAEVEALFEADGQEVVIRRVVEAEGRSRAYIDGRLATAAEVAERARGLLDISSQHEHHSLTDPSSHLGYLDAFAGIVLAPMAEAYGRLRKLEAELDTLDAAARESRADLLRFQLGELDKGGVTPEEEAEAEKLRHADAIIQRAARAEGLLADDGAACALLSRCFLEVEGAARFDPALEPLLGQLEAARAEVEDVARAIGRYARGVHADPVRLAAIEERIHEAKRLRRKFGEDLVGARERLARELDGLIHATDRIEQLREAIEQARVRVADEAAAVGRARRAAAARLGAAITEELHALGMVEARLELAVAACTLGPTGADRAEIVIAPNRGEEARPLRRIASGGELSRTLLAIKRVLAQLGPVGLYVFDEVDTGVGGAVAEVIGRKLAEVAAHHQVLCITHAPQIAAWGDAHFHVRKQVAGERTVSSIQRLDDGEQLEEIARMLGGVRVGAAARAAARELLRSAA